MNDLRVQASWPRAGASLCAGYNSSNSLPCRNAVSPTKVQPYCHLHVDQAQSFASQSTMKLHDITIPITPPLRIKPKEKTIAPLQLEQGGIRNQLRSVQTLPAYLASHQSEDLQSAHMHSQKRFSMKSMLQTLFEIKPRKAEFKPVKSPPVSSYRKPVPEVKSQESAPGYAKRNSPTYTGGTIHTETTTRQEQIAKDHIEIQALFSSPRSGVRVSRSINNIHLHDYVARYLAPSEYQHKSLQSIMRMQNAIEATLIAARTHVSQDREWIYVFREDGDFTWTEKIYLKIGRSKDVEARLKQWYKQCKHSIDILEKVSTPDATLVERMLHLEFEEDRVLKACQCGRTHREWFAIQRDGAKGRLNRAVMKWNAFAEEVAQYGS